MADIPPLCYKCKLVPNLDVPSLDSIEEEEVPLMVTVLEKRGRNYTVSLNHELPKETLQNNNDPEITLISNNSFIPKNSDDIIRPLEQKDITVEALPPLVPPFGNAVDMIISYVEENGSIYIQLCEFSSMLDEIMKKLEDLINKCGELSTFEIGSLCASRYSVDNLWYRAKIIFANTEISQAHIKYIDYGNTEIVSFSFLRSLPLECSLLPEQAISCKIYSESTDSIFEGERLKLLPWLNGCYIQATIKDDDVWGLVIKNAIIEGNFLEQKLISEFDNFMDSSFKADYQVAHILTPKSSPNSHEIYNGLGKQFGTDILKLKKQVSDIAVIEQLDETQAFHDFEMKKFDNCCNLNIASLEIFSEDPQSIFITFIENDSSIWIQLSQNYLNLQQLANRLDEYIKQENVVNFSSNDICVGSYCLSKYSVDSQIYRGIVLESEEPSCVTVHFIDYGNVENVSIENVGDLIKMPSEFAVLPRQALHCNLEACITENLDMSLLYDTLIESQYCESITGRFSVSNDSATIADLKVGGIPFIDVVNSKMAVENCCPDKNNAGSTREVIVTTDVLPEKDGAFLNDNLENLLYLSDECDEKDDTIIVESEETQAIQDFEMKKFDNCCNLNIASLEISSEEPQSIYITFIENDSSIWIQLSQNYLILQQLANHLDEYIKQENVVNFSSNDICVGSYCLSKYSVDSQIYRGIVLESEEPSCVTVHFIDYGNVEKVSIENVEDLIKMPSEFAVLPRQALHCNLEACITENLDMSLLYDTLIESQYCESITGRFSVTNDSATIADLKVGGIPFIDVINSKMAVENCCPDKNNAGSTREVIVTTDVLPEKDGALLNDNLENLLYLSAECDEKDDTIIVKSEETQAIHDFEMKKFDDCCNLNIASLEISSEEPQSIYITFIENDSSIWIQLSQNYLILQQLANHLDEYIKQENVVNFSSNDICVGSYCLSKYSVDSQIYRGIVLESKEPSCVTVHFIDYGNVEKVSIENVGDLIKMPSEFAVLSRQALHCNLEACITENLDMSLLYDTLIESQYCESITGRFSVTNDSATIADLKVGGIPFIDVVNSKMAVENCCPDKNNAGSTGEVIVITDVLPEKNGGFLNDNLEDLLYLRAECDEKDYTIIVESEETQAIHDFEMKKLDNCCNLNIASLEISSEEPQSIYITFIENDSSIWIQLSQNYLILQQLANHLDEYIKQENVVNFSSNDICVGSYCLSKYSVDSQIYRGIVLESEEPSCVTVHFIDYGNVEKVSIENVGDLIKMPSEFAVLSRQALHCNLEACITENLDMSLLYDTLIESQYCESITGRFSVTNDSSTIADLKVGGIPFIDVVNSKMAVENCCPDKNNAGSTREVIVTTDVLPEKDSAFLNDNLENLLCLSAECDEKDDTIIVESEETQAIQDFEMKKFDNCCNLNIASLEISSEEPQSIYITFIENDSSIWIQLSQNYLILQQLANHLDEYIKQENVVNFSSNDICVGSYCLSKYSVDSQIYRGIVLKSEEPSCVTVHFIDYGNVNKVSIENVGDLIKMPSEFAVLSRQALHCNLEACITENLDMSLLYDTLIESQYCESITGRFSVTNDSATIADLKVGGIPFIDVVNGKMAVENCCPDKNNAGSTREVIVTTDVLPEKDGALLNDNLENLLYLSAECDEKDDTIIVESEETQAIHDFEMKKLDDCCNMNIPMLEIFSEETKFIYVSDIIFEKSYPNLHKDLMKYPRGLKSDPKDLLSVEDSYSCVAQKESQKSDVSVCHSFPDQFEDAIFSYEGLSICHDHNNDLNTVQQIAQSVSDEIIKAASKEIFVAPTLRSTENIEFDDNSAASLSVTNAELSEIESQTSLLFELSEQDPSIKVPESEETLSHLELVPYIGNRQFIEAIAMKLIGIEAENYDSNSESSKLNCMTGKKCTLNEECFQDFINSYRPVIPHVVEKEIIVDRTDIPLEEKHGYEIVYLETQKSSSQNFAHQDKTKISMADDCQNCFENEKVRKEGKFIDSQKDNIATEFELQGEKMSEYYDTCFSLDNDEVNKVARFDVALGDAELISDVGASNKQNIVDLELEEVSSKSKKVEETVLEKSICDITFENDVTSIKINSVSIDTDLSEVEKTVFTDLSGINVVIPEQEASFFPIDFDKVKNPTQNYDITEFQPNNDALSEENFGDLPNDGNEANKIDNVFCSPAFLTKIIISENITTEPEKYDNSNKFDIGFDEAGLLVSKMDTSLKPVDSAENIDQCENVKVAVISKLGQNQEMELMQKKISTKADVTTASTFDVALRNKPLLIQIEEVIASEEANLQSDTDTSELTLIEMNDGLPSVLDHCCSVKKNDMCVIKSPFEELLKEQKNPVQEEDTFDDDLNDSFGTLDASDTGTPTEIKNVFVEKIISLSLADSSVITKPSNLKVSITMEDSSLTNDVFVEQELRGCLATNEICVDDINAKGSLIDNLDEHLFFAHVVHVEEQPFGLWFVNVKDSQMEDQIAQVLEAEIACGLTKIEFNNIQVGITCLSYFCRSLLRARVISFDQSNVCLRFIDIGKKCFVSVHNIYTSPPSLKKIPSLAKRYLLPVQISEKDVQKTVSLLNQHAFKTLCACIDITLFLRPHLYRSNLNNYIVAATEGIGSLTAFLESHCIGVPCSYRELTHPNLVADLNDVVVSSVLNKASGSNCD